MPTLMVSLSNPSITQQSSESPLSFFFMAVVTDGICKCLLLVGRGLCGHPSVQAQRRSTRQLPDQGGIPKRTCHGIVSTRHPPHVSCHLLSNPVRVGWDYPLSSCYTGETIAQGHVAQLLAGGHLNDLQVDCSFLLQRAERKKASIPSGA